ncbi:MAG: phosphoribosyltransferase family protein [Arenicellales bacterium]
MNDKLYLEAPDLLEDAFRLGTMVLKSGYQPDYIVAIWRGGAPIGIAVQELLAWAGVKTDHIAIRTSSYARSVDQRGHNVRIHGLRYLVERINADDKLLLVDDVYDTGLTMKAIIDKLRRKARLNAPEDIRIAVPWYKPDRKLVDRTPDYYLHETDQWIKFPHSLEGLTEAEIKTNRPEIWEALHS